MPADTLVVPVQPDARLTVYFDGACPLCRAEIDHYRAQDGADRICFQDLTAVDSDPEGTGRLAPGLTTEQALARFHVRLSDGKLVSGAAAFVTIWRQLPRWQWAARIASLPGITLLLELAYRLFLPIRPVLSKTFGALQAWRASRQRG